jgi:hypothetical protein
MKDIRRALVALLLADPAVNSLVGGERVRPIRLPQGERGPSIVQTLMQFDNVATSAGTATQLANAVFDCLSGYRGTVVVGSDSPAAAITIHGIFQTSERDTYDSVTEMFNVQRDMQVWYWAY